ncbi:hypothetical protein Pst134EA_029243 [Puccinia striiformis f. sp. tritici]|uniref:hypothetical protein n=1 Tax=Puccinia striiformis f. sp. tritici TaxID=168172 RepID=UPI00200853FA|nr:hypothetical protein Pst134EA_029243 [Puccinia striiformis f. sp. tritici]KAH9447206.1 hypothetical protein Pst134EA_029243 [Puccinia striiformis f. sp. tritici]
MRSQGCRTAKGENTTYKEWLIWGSQTPHRSSGDSYASQHRQGNPIRGASPMRHRASPFDAMLDNPVGPAVRDGVKRSCSMPHRASPPD